MNKINGYTEEEAKTLVDFIKEGKQKGKTLTYLFELYGMRHGRAKGSVRNYYYTLMKNEKGDERIVRLLDGASLSVEKIREFTEEETDAALRNILAEKSKGFSVRKAIYNLAGGDDKLTLRLQNKYRNVLKKQPERIAEIATEMGLEEEAERVMRKRAAQSRAPENRMQLPERDLLRRRLENEINALYDRLAQALKAENERLRAENSRLKEENAALQLQN
ncbi:MAG: hypothetical protein IKA88_07360 [Clostridia bacterium]|nr:hypothetical protein [Clostridia bacterium]